MHLVDFQVVSRQKGARGVQTYEAVALQDVVLLGQNEEVYVLARYTPWDGLYVCVSIDFNLSVQLTLTDVPLPQLGPRRSRHDGRIQRF